MTSESKRQQPLRPDNASSRQRIFGRIQAARAQQAPGSQTGLTPQTHGAAPAAEGPSTASLRQRMGDGARGPQPVVPASLTDSFVQKALALSCTVDRVDQPAHIAPAIAAYLTSSGLPAHVVAWPSLSQAGWLDSLTAHGLSLRLGAPTGDDLVGLSSVSCAVAETGTLVLRSSPDTPASTHLLPETHIAVLSCDDIVLTLEDAFERLKASGQPLPRALNLVSGPSRTGDIEQTIVLGAHGPYRVHLVLVDGA